MTNGTPAAATAPAPGAALIKEAEDLLHAVDEGRKGLRQLYGLGDPRDAESDKNPLLPYMKQLRKAVRSPLTADNMIERLKQARQAYEELHTAFGGEGDITSIEDPAERGEVAGKRLLGLLPSAQSVGKIRRAFDRLTEIINDPSLSQEDKKKIRGAARALREHYRDLSIGSGNRHTPETMLIDDMEDVFRLLDMMLDTNIKISDWQAKGGKGEAPWVFAGCYTDGMHRVRPIMVRAC